MAQLDVEPKKNNDWWKWALGILAAIIIIWLIVDNTGDDTIETDDMETDDMEQTTRDTTAILNDSEANPEIARYNKV